MPNITPSRTMLSVTPSAPPTSPSVPAAAAGSGAKKSAPEPKCRASRKPNMTPSISATVTSARPDRPAPTPPIEAASSRACWPPPPAPILMFGNLISAIVFDFDGLILDTEEPVYRSWLEVYQAHGQELPFERWVQIVGSTNAGFHPQHHLEERLGRPLPEDVLDRRIHRRT